MPTEKILVGYDGSAGARAATDWALAEAARTGAPVELVCAYDRPVPAPAAPLVPATGARPDATADRRIAAMLDDARAAARGSHPAVPVTTEVVRGAAAAVLADRSRSARLLVLGSHGHGGWTHLLLGSVSLAVATHAHCPVVVLPAAAAEARDAEAPVVAGVDGSEGARLALGFAFEQAATRGVPLRVVTAWRPGVPDWSEGLLDGDTVPREQLDHVENLIAGWRRTYPAVPVSAEAVDDHPARALVRASRTAQLVVVGSRGRGGLRGLLLGSVSQHVLHHGHCAVAVVRATAVD